MVAISVYKGNLHRVPDTPRQWLMPTRKITPKDFQTLIQRRSRTLSRLQSNPNPNPNPNPSSNEIINNDSRIHELLNSSPHENGNDCFVIPADELVAEEKTQPSSENQLPFPKDDFESNKELRKKEVEEKLQILNERKHKLVQVLKQILNAEEELRRRNTVQGTGGHPSVSLQVDVTNDSGSFSRHVTPRPGSEGPDVGGVEADDVSNHNMHSRNMARMSSMSPSSETLPRRPPFSMVPNPSRGIVASSPSRFAPTSNGQQHQGGNLPSVSVTGTNYVASSPSPSPSPSPAGSVGTSVFRDAVASPWN